MFVLCLLSRGLTQQATFALLVRMLYLKLIFTAIDIGVLKDSTAILRNCILTDSFPCVQFVDTLLNFVTVHRQNNCIIIIRSTLFNTLLSVVCVCFKLKPKIMDTNYYSKISKYLNNVSYTLG